MASSTPANAELSVPLDVVETIIDVLATIDDQRLSSVKACSLTCQSFLHFCRKHIFASVSLDIRELGASSSYPTSAQFQKVLITAPEISNYVRKLSFGIPTDNSRGDFSTVLNLAEVLKKFRKIQELTIGSFNMAPINWDNLPDYLQDAIFHLLDLPTIDYLVLLRISHFPVLDLTRCSNLRRLHVGFFTNPVLDQNSPSLHPRSVVLEEYTMGWQCAEAMKEVVALKWPDEQPVLDFRQLQKYSTPYQLDLEDTAIEVTREILKKTNHLASIDLQCVGTANLLSGFSDTFRHSLKSLRRIDLRCFFNRSWSQLRGFSDQLKMMRKWPNILEELELHIHPLTYISMLLGIDEEWGCELDESLNDSRWSSLKKVSIIVTAVDLAKFKSQYDEDWDSTFRKECRTQFPFLSSSKTITFTINVVSHEAIE